MRSTATTLATVDMEDDKVLTKLATEATNLNLDDVANTITLVKVGETDKESVKRLKAAYVKPLTRTYAFLMNLKEDDEEVTKFTRPGLAEMIFYRLKQLMPKGCKTCNTVQINQRDEVLLIKCKLCGCGACKDCFPSEERSSKWSFLCGSCDEQIANMMGEKTLDKSHFRLKKKQEKAEERENSDERMDNEEDANIEEDAEDGGEGDEEVVEVTDDGDDFQEPKKRGFLAKKKTDEKTKSESERKAPVCHHFKNARCHHGMSGKLPHNGVPKCPFRHPMICQKLLRNGDRNKGGCRGKVDGCKDFHGVKMCFSSMNTKKCDHQKDCKNGYHTKGTVVKQAKDQKKEKSDKKVDNQPKVPKAGVQPIVKGTETEKLNLQNPGENNSNLSSFLGQLFLQQQEMMAEQQQQRKEQVQIQQQMLQLMTRLGGALEGRMSPLLDMGAMQGRQTASFRPVGL